MVWVITGQGGSGGPGDPGGPGGQGGPGDPGGQDHQPRLYAIRKYMVCHGLIHQIIEES